MDDIILDEEDGVGYDVPDVPHVNIVFDGINDTLANVEGTESLTQAQVYLQGVLSASGIVSNRVAGNEGFFTSVGSGLKSALDYVKKMFKSLWDFFFKRDAAALAEAAKKELGESKDALVAITSGGATEAEATSILSKQISTLKALGHEPDANKSALDQILKEADEAHKGSYAEKKAAILMLSRELPKLNKKAKKELGGKIDRMIAVLKTFTTTIDDAVKDGSTVGAEMKTALGALKKERDEYDQFMKDLEAARDLSDIGKAKDLLTKLLSGIDSVDAANKQFKGLESSLGAQIKQVESLIGEDKDKEELGKRLGDLRGIMTLVSKMSQCFKAMLSTMSSLQKSVNALFGA